MRSKKFLNKMKGISLPENEDFSAKLDDITTALLGIRDDIEQTEYFVELLEEEKILNMMNKEERKNFCKLYTDKLLEKYLRILFKSDLHFKSALDLMRAIYGFKEDFDIKGKTQKIRYVEYYQKTNNHLFGNLKTESSMDTTLRNIMQEIINELAKCIIKKILKEGDGKKLNLLKTDPEFQELLDNDIIERTKIHIKNDSNTSDKSKTINRNNAVAYYIKSILKAEYHDEESEALYKALCGKDDPPDKEWVATWLTNCIHEKFKDTIDRDIMLVSFALLPGYELNGKDGLEDRLNKYLLESIYSDTHPCKSRKPIEYIIGRDPEETSQIKAKLEARRKRLVNEFIEHIENKDCSEHIENIKDYATSSKKHHFYAPKLQDILFSKENIKLAQRREKMIKNALTACISVWLFVCLPLFFIGIFLIDTVSKNLSPNSEYLVGKDIVPEESKDNLNRRSYVESDGITPNMTLQDNIVFNDTLLAHTLKHVEE